MTKIPATEYLPSGRLFKVFQIALLLPFFLAASAAAAPETVPPPADAGRIEQRFDVTHPPTPAQSTPEAPPVVSGPPPASVPAGAEKIHFVLRKVNITGVTVYSQKQLAAFYQDDIGKDIHLSEVYHIADKITQLYSRDGYALSSAGVPPQAIKDGIITIAVVEGSIGEVRTQGAYRDTYVTRGIIERIKAMHPLNANMLERYMLLLNDLGGVNVHAVLEKMSGSNPPPGTVAIRLVFEDKPGSYSVTIDNYGSRYLGPLEVSVNATKGNVITPYDQLTVSGIGSLPFSELRYMSSQYTVPLNSNGLSLALAGGFGTADPGYRLEADNVQNNSYNIGATLSWEMLRQRNENFTISGGVAIKNAQSDIEDLPLYDDNLRELHAGAVYNLTDSYKGVNTIDTELTQGIDALGASHPGSLDLSRSEANSEFTKLNVTINRLQDISNSFQIYAATTGQVTNNVLMTSEEFGYGGQAFGRAFDTSEIIGDDGWAGSLELRYNGLPNPSGITSQPFIFYDVGKVWSIDTLGIDESGASAGIGLRFATDYHISGTFTLAQPLTREVAANSPRTGYSPRGFFSLSCQF